MTTQTAYYDLTLYNATTDNVALFATYRAAVDGVSNSNMIKIDTALASLQSQITISGFGSVYMDIVDGGSSAYAVTGISSITGYVTGQGIIIKPDTTNVGTATLDINSLGVKYLSKMDVSGTVINLDANDIIINKLYYFVYDGTYWILIGTLTARDIAETIHASTNKTTPINADELGIWDSVTGILNRVSFTNIKAFLKTYFDTLYIPFVTPGTNGNVLTSNGTIWQSSAPTGGGGHTIQDEGTPLTQRTNLNFVGTGVTATDDSGNNATVITISGGTSASPSLNVYLSSNFR